MTLLRDLEHRGAGGNGRLGVDGQRDIGELSGIGHGAHDAVGMPGLSDGGLAHLDARIAGLHLVALLDVAGEALALHVHGVDADVDEDLNAVVARDAHGVAHGDAHGAGDRCVHGLLVRPDGAALAHDLTGEHRIGHIGHLDDAAAHGRGDNVGTLRSGHGSGASGRGVGPSS